MNTKLVSWLCVVGVTILLTSRRFSTCSRTVVSGTSRRPTRALVNVQSSVPIPLVSGSSLDAITPPTSAELVAKNLPNAHLVTFPGVCHGVSVESPECFTSMMLAFLDSPQTFDQGCVSAVTTAPFVTSSDAG